MNLGDNSPQPHNRQIS